MLLLAFAAPVYKGLAFESTGDNSSASTFQCGTGYKTDPSGICIPDTGPQGGFAGKSTLTELILYILQILLSFAGIIAVVMLVYGGYMYIASAGNEERAEKGRRILTNAIIGLVVVALAYTIVVIVNNFVTKPQVF